jgi:hypothetical protein
MPRQKGASKSLTLDKRSKIMIAVLAVILVGAGAFFLLHKSSSSNSSASGLVPVPKPAAGAVKPKISAAPKVKPLATPSPVVTADSTRDPFVPLAQEAVATTSSDPAGTSSPAPSASATPTAAPTTSAPAAGDHNVMVLSITGTTATVSYNNGTGKSVKAGDTLATGVSVVKIDADSIVISYGNKIYAVAPGQTVTF